MRGAGGKPAEMPGVVWREDKKVTMRCTREAVQGQCVQQVVQVVRKSVQRRGMQTTTTGSQMRVTRGTNATTGEFHGRRNRWRPAMHPDSITNQSCRWVRQGNEFSRNKCHSPFQYNTNINPITHVRRCNNVDRIATACRRNDACKMQINRQRLRQR